MEMAGLRPRSMLTERERRKVWVFPVPCEIARRPCIRLDPTDPALHSFVVDSSFAGTTTD